MRSILCGMVLVVGSMCLGADAPADKAAAESLPPATQPTSKPIDEKLLYAAGVSFGQRVREGLTREGYAYEDEVLLQGVRDGLRGSDMKYPQEELDEAINKVEALVRTRRAERRYNEDPQFKELADTNLRHSEEALKHRLQMFEVEVLPSGIQVEVLKEGDGPIAATGKHIKVNFEIRLIDGALVDESPKGKPVTLPLWRLSPAMQDALAIMPVGSTWRIAIPPEHAFGIAGKPPLIGPNEAIVVEFTLVGVE